MKDRVVVVTGASSGIGAEHAAAEDMGDAERNLSFAPRRP